MRRRLSVVNLGVADLERTRRFYVEGMKLPTRPESSERAFWIEMNRVWLGFFKRDRLAELAGQDPQGSGFPGVVFSHNVSSAGEVDAVLAEAEQAGGTIVTQATDRPDGQSRVGYFADPDGFRWEVAYTPRWPDLTNPPD